MTTSIKCDLRGLAIFSWASLILSIFCRPYSSNCAVEKGENMFKSLFMMMDYSTFMKWQLLAIVSGAGLGWCAAKWEEAYKEARDAGAVA